MKLRHLLSITDLEPEEIHSIIDKAALYKAEFQQGARPSVIYKQATALIFLENSTRTSLSFERANQLLGKTVIRLQVERSSLEKGETLLDTLANIHALSCDIAVVRCREEGLLQDTARHSPMSILNAGDGKNEHPSQALLDLMTLWAGPAGHSWDRLKQLKLLIVGDLKHSRVGHSWYHLAKTLGLQVTFSSPTGWRPRWGVDLNWTDRPKAELKNFDTVMALRVQKERLSENDAVDQTAYIRDFQFSTEDLRPAQNWLMHPGPVNWGVELGADLQNYSRSLILKQVECGLYVRAALLDFFSSERNHS